jgi:hypothetical protein
MDKLCITKLVSSKYRRDGTKKTAHIVLRVSLEAIMRMEDLSQNLMK